MKKRAEEGDAQKQDRKAGGEAEKGGFSNGEEWEKWAKLMVVGYYMQR